MRNAGDEYLGARATASMYMFGDRTPRTALSVCAASQNRTVAPVAQAARAVALRMGGYVQDTALTGHRATGERYWVANGDAVAVTGAGRQSEFNRASASNAPTGANRARVPAATSVLEEEARA